jgi:hypothetical protein
MISNKTLFITFLSDDASYGETRAEYTAKVSKYTAWHLVHVCTLREDPVLSSTGSYGDCDYKLRQR